MSFARELTDSPAKLVADLLYNEWQNIFATNEIDRDDLLWDQWFSNTRDITIRFKENFTTVWQGKRRPTGGNMIVTDEYNIAKHYISPVDMHIFVRDNTLTNQIDIIPIELDLILTRLDDFVEKNPRVFWDSQGISNFYVDNIDANVPFDDPNVYRAIITFKLEYTKIDKPLEPYTRS